jgi:hypothetical protein
MTLFLTKSQVEKLSQEDCQKHLRLLNREYHLDRPIGDRMSTVWPIMDDIVNTLLYLEDRIKHYENPYSPPTSAPLPLPPKPTPVKQVRRRRKFRVGDVIYNSVVDASEQLGLKEHTLRNYVTRDPKKYGYLD